MVKKSQKSKIKGKKHNKKTAPKKIVKKTIRTVVKRKKLPVKTKRIQKKSAKKSIFHKVKTKATKIRELSFSTFDRLNFVKHHPKITITGSLFIIAFGTVFYWFILKDLPSVAALTTIKTPMTTIIRDRNGKILYKVYKTANRIPLTWEEIPELVKNATIAIEDADFYNHHGVSGRSLLRAFLFNLQQKNINQYQGGSTITQQLVKNKLLGNKKVYSRKLKEIVLAPIAELKYKKNEILNMYLNEVGYGSTAYGIEAASEMYFNKPAKDLSLAQAAFLAGLPAAPTTFSPFGINPELSFVRQNQVLDRMLKLRMISKEDFESAKEEKLTFAPQKTDILAPHFVMYVKQQLVDKLGEELVEEGGLDVTTTLDLNVQERTEEIVKKNIEEVKDRYNIHNGATVVTDTKSGEILAMVGSANYWDTANKGYVNVATMPRQPGSSIKPVNYALAFDRGLTPNSVIDDSPVVYVAKGAESYAPQNYDGRFHGTVTLRSALANSYNIPAVKLLNINGVKNMVDLGRKMGIKNWPENPQIGLSLTLGGLEATMLDMARVYLTIANLGVKTDIRIIKEIADRSDNDITSLFYNSNKDVAFVGSVQAEENSQVISPLSAYWVTNILSDNVARLPAFGPYAKLSIPNQTVAVKTGTSNNYRDNWTIGFSPDYLVATWVGNTDGSYMNKNLVSGITGAAPIWNETMSSLLQDKPKKDFPIPQGLIPVKICAVNGLLTCANCPQEKTEYFTADKVPTKQCFFRSKSDCDNAKTQLDGKSDDEKKQLLSGCPN